MGIFPEELLPYGEDGTIRQISLSQIYDDLNLLTKNIDKPLKNLQIKYPHLADAVSRIYLAHSIFSESNPLNFELILSKFPKIYDYISGTIGEFLYGSVTVCYTIDEKENDKICEPINIHDLPIDMNNTELFREKNNAASIWLYVNGRFTSIISKSNNKADIYIPYTKFEDFVGLRHEELEDLKNANIEEARFMSSTGSDLLLTDYKKLKDIPLLNSGTSKIINSSNDDDSSPWLGWGIAILIILLLILFFFVVMYSR